MWLQILKVHVCLKCLLLYSVFFFFQSSLHTLCCPGVPLTPGFSVGLLVGLGAHTDQYCISKNLKGPRRVH